MPIEPIYGRPPFRGGEENPVTIPSGRTERFDDRPEGAGVIAWLAVVWLVVLAVAVAVIR